MKKTLLVSASEQSAKALAQLLRQEGYPSVTTVYAAYSARERSEETAYDLIVINAPLIDENGVKLAEHFAETTRASVVVIAPQKIKIILQAVTTEE